jgi:hypothetical protein
MESLGADERSAEGMEPVPVPVGRLRVWMIGGYGIRPVPVGVLRDTELGEGSETEGTLNVLGEVPVGAGSEPLVGGTTPSLGAVESSG